MRFGVNLVILIAVLVIASVLGGQGGGAALVWYLDGGGIMHLILLAALAQVPVAAWLAKREASPVMFFYLPAAVIVLGVGGATLGWNVGSRILESAPPDSTVRILAAIVAEANLPKQFAMILFGATALMYTASTRGPGAPFIGGTLAFLAFSAAWTLGIVRGVLEAFALGSPEALPAGLEAATGEFAVGASVVSAALFSVLGACIFAWMNIPSARSAVLLVVGILALVFVEACQRRAALAAVLGNHPVDMSLPRSPSRAVLEVPPEVTSRPMLGAETTRLKAMARGASDCAPLVTVHEPATIRVSELVTRLHRLEACDVQIRTRLGGRLPTETDMPYVDSIVLADATRPFVQRARLFRPAEDLDQYTAGDIVVRGIADRLELIHRGTIANTISTAGSKIDPSSIRAAIEDIDPEADVFVYANTVDLQRLVDILGALGKRSVYWTGVEPQLSPVPVADSLSKEAIQAVVRRKLGQVRNCYEEQLIQVPTLAGSLNANFSIETNGSVAQVQIDVPAPEMQAVADCLKDKIAGWWFPAARDVSEVRYPFNFTPGE